jgi:hypothetical protein
MGRIAQSRVDGPQVCNASEEPHQPRRATPVWSNSRFAAPPYAGCSEAGHLQGDGVHRPRSSVCVVPVSDAVPVDFSCKGAGVSGECRDSGHWARGEERTRAPGYPATTEEGSRRCDAAGARMLPTSRRVPAPTSGGRQWCRTVRQPRRSRPVRAAGAGSPTPRPHLPR